MSRCPPRCCSGCRDKAQVERITRKAEIWRTEAVSDRPVPELHTDSEEEEPEEAEEPIKTEDCIFAIGLVPAPAEIRATSSVSQCLAKAFKRNSEPAPSGRSVPEYLKEFDSIFSKKSFDVLPESKKWDHAVKLIPGEKASNCKVYPLAPMEQKELDQFLKENLETGRIRPSKSLMVSWSMLSHVFSEEQLKDGSDGVSDDGRLTIVQCHHYHRPPLSDLYRSSVGIFPPLRYHQNNLHSYHCHYQPTPCALHDNSLYVYVSLQYKYSSLLYVFR